MERIEMMEQKEINWVTGDELLDFPYGAFKIGSAPDGLAWALKLGGRGEYPLAGCISSLDKIIMDEMGEKSEQVGKFRRAFRNLEREFFTLETKSGKYYVHRVPIDKVLGETLFQRVYNAHLSNLTTAGYPIYRLCKREETEVSLDTEKKSKTEFIAQKSKEKPEVRLEKEVKKYLLIPLNSGTLQVAEVRKGAPVSESIVKTRTVFFESISALEDKEVSGGIYVDIHDQIYNNLGSWYEEKIQNSTVFLRISLKKVLEKFLLVAKELESYHRKGLVHGDIKPANIIFTSDGVKIIDELDIKTGDKAPALTKIYVAPEVVLGDSVSPATDVYTLGIILSHLLGAIPYGEIRKWTLPIKGEGLKEFSILNCHSTNIAAEFNIANVSQLSHWEDIITSCLYFEQDKRISTEKFADEVSQLLNSFSSPREISMRLNFGDIGFVHKKKGKHVKEDRDLGWLVG